MTPALLISRSTPSDAVAARRLPIGPSTGRATSRALALGWAAILAIALLLGDGAPPLATLLLIAAAVAPLVTVAAPRSGTEGSPRRDMALQWELLRCRRREERAAVLVVGGPHVVRLATAFRVTDAVEVAQVRGGTEIHGVLEADGLQREGLEQRMSELLPGASFGWAAFPDDGVTLEVLLEHARASASHARPAEQEAA